MFYHFRQNNSGGSFDIIEEAGIGVDVFIEADSADEANAKALSIGIYFDGCSTGDDCSCCGDRWYEACGDGNPEPMSYGTPIAQVRRGYFSDRGYVHYKSGEWDEVMYRDSAS